MRTVSGTHRVEAASPTDAIKVVAEELAALVGARSVNFLIADFSGRALVPFETPVHGNHFDTPAHGIPGPRRQGLEQGQTVPLAGTVYEHVLRTQQVDVHELADGAHLTVPVTDRGDAIGVIELILPSYPDDQVVAEVAATAHALAYVVIANRRHTDLFEWGRRTTPFSRTEPTGTTSHRSPTPRPGTRPDRSTRTPAPRRGPILPAAR